jgi:hypothetical protein
VQGLANVDDRHRVSVPHRALDTWLIFAKAAREHRRDVPCLGRKEWTSRLLADKRHAALACTTCPIRSECLTYALTADEQYGIWGGFDMELPAWAKRELVEVLRAPWDARNPEPVGKPGPGLVDGEGGS